MCTDGRIRVVRLRTWGGPACTWFLVTWKWTRGMLQWTHTFRVYGRYSALQEKGLDNRVYPIKALIPPHLLDIPPISIYSVHGPLESQSDRSLDRTDIESSHDVRLKSKRWIVITDNVLATQRASALQSFRSTSIWTVQAQLIHYVVWVLKGSSNSCRTWSLPNCTDITKTI